MVHVANALDRETTFAQTGCLGRIGEIHFSIVEIDAGFAALIIVAVPVK